MMRHSELLGTHGGHDPRRMTVQELLDTLRQVPRQARHNYLQLDRADPQAALQFARSDQEKWDFHPEGRTIQELLDTLKQVPRQARHNYLMMVVSPSGSTELAALQFAQSDQAEKWDFRVYLVGYREEQTGW